MDVPHDEIEGCRRAHIRLGEVVRGLRDGDVARPSALPGWTVGHVLVHLTQNAQAMSRRIDAATRSEMVDQYPGGPAMRASAIERAAHGPPDEIRRAVVASAEHLDGVFAGLDERVWSRSVRTVAGTEHPVSLLPYRRWREVEVHLVDLGCGVTPQDWPDALVDRSLGRLVANLCDRADRRALMAWLLGRGPAPDLDPWG